MHLNQPGTLSNSWFCDLPVTAKRGQTMHFAGHKTEQLGYNQFYEAQDVVDRTAQDIGLNPKGSFTCRGSSAHEMTVLHLVQEKWN